jgi:hypothetical protein
MLALSPISTFSTFSLSAAPPPFGFHPA